MNYRLDSASAILSRTPDVLRAMLHELPDEWLNASERPGAWSPRDVACHLADLERDAWLPRIRTILDHGRARPLAAIDRERFRTRYADASLDTVLADFASHREANLAALETYELDAAALAAVGLHHVLGEVSASQLLCAWVVHDLTHLAQITRALATQYAGAVGPWVEFLGILRARGDVSAPRA